jgi:hypothetical protein
MAKTNRVHSAVVLGWAHASKADHVDRPRTLADVAQTVCDSLSCQRTSYECGLQRCTSQRQLGGEHGGMSTSRPMSRPLRISLTRNLDYLLSFDASF